MARSNRELNSRPVVRIATSGVALGVALMILSAAIVQGFQHEVKSLVVGFDSHVQIAHSDPGATGVVWTPGRLDSLRRVPGVEHVALRHERAGIVETPEALQGVIVRGIDSTSNVTRVRNGLLRGSLPAADTDVLVGQPLASKLELDTGSRLTLYVVVGPDDIRPRPMRVRGVYETGLLEFDQRNVWVEASVIQDAARRGAEAQVVLEAAGGHSTNQMAGTAGSHSTKSQVTRRLHSDFDGIGGLVSHLRFSGQGYSGRNHPHGVTVAGIARESNACGCMPQRRTAKLA